MTVDSSTYSFFIATQSFCVASPLDSPQLCRFSEWIFPLSRPSKKAQKERFGSDAFWGLVCLGVPLGAGPIFAAFYELEVRCVLGPWDSLCFWRAVILVV